ncbi:winged helix-turn-helix domain-containing protein [Microbacterium koreense]|uniref:Winged helix-turn-helix domain-containing protein n=1 Tax=Microbacterium koreense TaxID=323761 RepID=A0ABW2ZQA2_9MICO
MTVRPRRGVDRAIVLSPSRAVRGTPAEFRHAGVAVSTFDDVLAAMIAIARDPEAMLIVADDVSQLPLADVLDLAVATCESVVVLGVTQATGADVALRIAVDAGVTTTVDLPLTPERVQQVLRRNVRSAREPDAVQVGALRIDRARHEVSWQGIPLDLSPREFVIVEALTNAYPSLATLEQLVDECKVTGSDPFASIRVAVTRIRGRLAEHGVSREEAIETVRGVGYRLAC